MLENIGKLDRVKNTVDHAKSITKFIYNHSWILSLMRKHVRGKDIIRPAITRFATHFLTSQFMLSQHKKLAKDISYFLVKNGIKASDLTNREAKN